MRSTGRVARSMRSLSLQTLVLLSLAGGALAQQAPPPTTLEGRVTTLRADVDELKKLTVEIPTLQKTVNDISAQLAALKQEVDPFRRVNETEVDERARLDQLDARLTVLGQQVSGVRAELQARSAPEASAPFGSATYKDGFLLSTEDGAFAIRLKGYMQLRYILRTAESDAAEVDESSFILRRARTVFDGNVYSPKLGYKFMADFGQGNIRLLDYYLEGKVHDRL